MKRNVTRNLTRAFLALALLCAAAPAQAQISKITGASLALWNSPITGGALTYSWTAPTVTGGRTHSGYILHMRIVPDPPDAPWLTSDFGSLLPAGAEVAGTTIAGGFRRLSTSSTAITIHGLQAGRWQMRIGASEEDGENGAFSDLGEITIPAAPGGLTASRSANTISASWDAVAGATGYKVRWASDAQNWVNAAGAAGEDASGTSHSITGLDAAETYEVQVAAVFAAGVGAWSASVDESGAEASSDASLSALVLTDMDDADLAATFSPAFTPENLQYFVTLPDSASRIKVRPTAPSADSITVSIFDAKNDYSSLNIELAAAPVESGALTPSRSLISSSGWFNLVTVEVIAANRADRRTYNFHISRPRNGSDDATLSNLAFKHSGADAELTKVGGDGGAGFDAAHLEYEAFVASAVGTVTFLPTANHAGARIRAGKPGAFGAAAASGGVVEHTVVSGEKLAFTVTAQSGAQNIYTVTVSNPSAPGAPQNPAATAGAAKFRLNWEAANENGSAVTGYTVRWINSANTFTHQTGADARAHTALGLAAGDYTVQVAAANAEGDGPYTAAATVAVRAYDADVDETGGVTGRDGIMLARYLLGARAAGVTGGQTAADADLVEENAKNGADLDLLDINGDNAADGDDGILIARYAFGLRGEDLTRGVDDDADEDAITAMETKLRGLGL